MPGHVVLNFCEKAAEKDKISSDGEDSGVVDVCVDLCGGINLG